MIEQVMAECNNYFAIPGKALTGVWEVADHSISLPFLAEGQYFKIEGSVFNDGVYQYPAQLQDETFRGRIIPLAVPKDFIQDVSKIKDWQAKNGAPSQYESEEFGGYAYTLAKNAKGGQITWADAFKSELRRWRKL